MADGNLVCAIGGDVWSALEKLETQAKTRDAPADFWAVRGVPLDVRAMAAQVAESRGLTVGEWLTQVIIDQDRADREAAPLDAWFAPAPNQASLPAPSPPLDLTAIRESISAIVAYAQPDSDPAVIDWTAAPSDETDEVDPEDVSMTAEALALDAVAIWPDATAESAAVVEPTLAVTAPVAEVAEAEAPEVLDTLWRYVRTTGAEPPAVQAEVAVAETAMTFVVPEIVEAVISPEQGDVELWLPVEALAQQPVRRKSLLSRIFGGR